MKRKMVRFLIGAMVLLAGCGSDGGSRSTLEENESKEQKETSEENGNKSQDKNRSENGQYTWQGITVTLPEEWEGRYVISEDQDGFSICQKASYSEENCSGYLCGVQRMREYMNYGWGESLLAYTDEGTLYYFMQPTDVSCDSEDEKILGEYVEMCQRVEEIRNSVRIDISGIHLDADEYILPLSSILELDEEVLLNLSDNSLWIARNEIYARHGRQFTNEYLQNYFNRCTWYEGTTPADQFQESSLNPLEKANVTLLTEAEQKYKRQHPYPMECKDAANEDLDGDGQSDSIACRVTESENGERQFAITVNGVSYDTAGEVDWVDPLADVFYITDILESDNALEIALLDNGPSEDPVTHFFRYEDGLSYIGQVAGFPFAAQNGGVNGFDGMGGITGYVRMDLAGTMYLQGYWLYDGRSVIYQDMGWNRALPADGHILQTNLPVHFEADESSATAVIPAQAEVFFLGSDLKEWVEVKAKDGTKGYIRMKDGQITGLRKSVEEVFSDLRYFD